MIMIIMIILYTVTLEILIIILIPVAQEWIVLQTTKILIDKIRFNG